LTIYYKIVFSFGTRFIHNNISRKQDFRAAIRIYVVYRRVEMRQVLEKTSNTIISYDCYQRIE